MPISHTRRQLLTWIAVIAGMAIAGTLSLLLFSRWREQNTAKVTLQITDGSEVSTLAIIVRSPLVIKSALHRPEVRDLAIIQNQRAPEEWLHQALWVHADHDARELHLQLGSDVHADMSEKRLLLSALVDAMRELAPASSQNAIFLPKMH